MEKPHEVRINIGGGDGSDPDLSPPTKNAADQGYPQSAASVQNPICFICRLAGPAPIGSLATAIRASEQPRLPAQGDAAQGAFGGIVRQADAAVVEEAGEGGPAFEHVVHGLGEIVAARQLGALFAHPAFQIGVPIR
jgi:hypothetical protein